MSVFVRWAERRDFSKQNEVFSVALGHLGPSNEVGMDGAAIMFFDLFPIQCPGGFPCCWPLRSTGQDAPSHCGLCGITWEYGMQDHWIRHLPVSV